MSTLSFTLIQTDLFWQQPEANRERFDQWIRMATPSDIVVLPETFTTGFSMNRSHAEPFNGQTVKWMVELSAAMDTVICGSLLVEDQGRYVNRFVWVEPNGSIQYYDKRHLFSMGEEHLHFAPGAEQLIIEYKGWRIAPFICYDLRFPVWLRRTSRFDYDLLLGVANWPDRRAAHWNALIPARAIENQSYVIALNRVGNDGMDVWHSGHSQVISPKGEVVCLLNGEQQIQRVELDLQLVKDWRAQFPTANDADTFTLA